MKLNHERLDAYEEAAVYEYEYGEEAASAALANDSCPDRRHRCLARYRTYGVGNPRRPAIARIVAGTKTPISA